MSSQFQNTFLHRSQLLLGEEGLAKLHDTSVILFGVGGVGSWCAECLIRNGIGHLTIVDSDLIAVTNCNRQLEATPQTVGQVKVEAMRRRLLELNPEADVVAIPGVYTAETADSFHLETYDFIIDAIDSLSDKADLILRATSLPRHITFISSMGAALRSDPFRVRHGEFWSIQGDALARALRNKFKKNKTFPGRKFQCVYSEEPTMSNLLAPTQALLEGESCPKKAAINGSLCHVTAIFGFSIAGMVINKVVGK